jgi:hypothetical protein
LEREPSSTFYFGNIGSFSEKKSMAAILNIDCYVCLKKGEILYRGKPANEALGDGKFFTKDYQTAFNYTQDLERPGRVLASFKVKKEVQLLNMALEQTWEALRVQGNQINGLSLALEIYLNRTAYFNALRDRTDLNGISYQMLSTIWPRFVVSNIDFVHLPFYVDYDSRSALNFLESIATTTMDAGWIYPETHTMQWLRNERGLQARFHPEIAIQNPQDYLDEIIG